MAGKSYTLEEIETQFRGLAAMVATAQGLTGRIIIHKGITPGAIRLELNLEGDPLVVAQAVGTMAACTR